MSVAFSPRLLLRESAPVVGILSVWGLLAALMPPEIASQLQIAGLILGLLYTVLRGVSLSREIPRTKQTADFETNIRESVGVLLPAGLWFIAALFFGDLLQAQAIIPILWGLADGFVYAFSWTGVSVVLLYAIAVGLPRFRAAQQPSPSSLAED